jgi:CheY-like chemotaxis protein
MHRAKVKSLEDRRIFLIEDDIVNLAVMGRLLSNNNAVVLQNYNSIGIVVHVRQSLPIDLILLDINLRRGIRGYEIIDQLRADPLTAQIPVVAVTALDPETEIPKAKEKGFNGYISKPIDPVTFATDLVDIMNGHSKWVISS